MKVLDDGKVEIDLWITEGGKTLYMGKTRVDSKYIQLRYRGHFYKGLISGIAVSCAVALLVLTPYFLV